MTGQGRGIRLPIRVSPRSSRNGIDGVVDGRLRVLVTASPVDGAANDAVVRLIADALGLPPSVVRIAVGGSGRDKLVEVQGATRAGLVARWPDLGV